MTEFKLIEPTGDQCNARAKLGEDEFNSFYAVWYPQMGGYIGKAVAAIGKGDDGCVDIFVWHDGMFPFSDDADPSRSPAMIHHCVIDQFRRLADDIEALQEMEWAKND